MNWFFEKWKKLVAYLTLISFTGLAFAAAVPLVPNAIGTDRYIKLSNREDSITAHAGGGQTLAYQLTAQFSRVTTVATAADSVALPKINSNTPGQSMGALGSIAVVRNDGANAMQVYAYPSDTINGIASATGVSVAAGETAMFFVQTYNSTTGIGNWVQMGQNAAAPVFTTINATTGNITTLNSSSVNVAGTLSASNVSATGGAVNASAVNATGASTFGTINPASGIFGVTTNSNAASGAVGEYGQSIIASGSAVSLTTASGVGITSLTLGAGDWDTEATICYHTSGTTNVSDVKQGITSASGVFGTVGTLTYNWISSVPPTTDDQCYVTPTVRISLAASAVEYVSASADFTVSTLTAYGSLRARRPR